MSLAKKNRLTSRQSQGFRAWLSAGLCKLIVAAAISFTPSVYAQSQNTSTFEQPTLTIAGEDTRESRQQLLTAAASTPLQLNTFLPSCGPEQYRLQNLCLDAAILNKKCTDLAGQASWNGGAFFCRSSNVTNGVESSSDQQSAATSARPSLRPETLSFTSNAIANTGLTRIQICQRRYTAAGTEKITGRICRTGEERRARPQVVGQYSFTFSSPQNNSSIIACATQRVESIVTATAAHYRDQPVNAAKVYRFCTISGKFEMTGRF